MTASITQIDKQLDNLGSALVHVDPADALMLALAMWRRAGEEQPFGPLVDTDTAVATIRAAVRRRRATRRRPVVAAALCFAVFLALGLALLPLTPWWWTVPAAGLVVMAGLHRVVATMRDDTQWTAAQARAEQNGAGE